MSRLMISKDGIQSSEFMSDLKWWAIKYRICLNAISDLLQILKKHIPILSFLPKDARTFLRTPRENNIINLAGGLYWHCGLRNFIEKLIIDYDKLALPSNIDLILNIDGLPLAKSSKVSFWPILVSDIKLKNVYMVGCYYGNSKPSSANDFMKEFIHELISINNKLPIQVSLYAIVCDAPAKLFLLSTKGHIGYDSCSKCYIQGTHKNSKVCFVENVPSRLRTDTDFLEQTDVDYHKGETILTIVPNLGLVTNVPLDYMHLICLGVVKKLLILWIKRPFSVRLNSTQIQKISKLLIKIRERTPIEFVRKPRSLNDAMYWKATEFRQFLLYTGPVVLNGFIRQDIYINFLTLHVAISILINPKLIKNQNNILYAEKLLTHFVKSFQIIYGDQFVTHNIHNLLHLSRDVQKFGALDEFSAFRFENYLQMLKNILRKSDRPLQQVARRFGEMHACEYQFHSKLDNQSNTILKNKHCAGPLPNNLIMQNNLNQYKILKTHLYYINCKEDKNNCCVLKDGSNICVVNIIQSQNLEIFIIGVKCNKLNTLYSLPCSSGKLNIHIISKTTEMSLWPITEIEGKVYNLLNSKNESIAIPLCHAGV
ncbi:uncharacterized protein LOC114932803 isoform X1 [Nylanderia fulva]|uniref:uncharacterized protein LOC114932803 isoform X1 n=1 Tax=Nylanderia fulva TaxID=613905 RepID=UPI0010FB5D73|nr:uncharacterized protein LOC114932803 isoform X1 [Nylanderia fulva]XP_029161036.1 uncharacterized protein LOC114932803 isoform X1 [Nylanderia fulva]